MQRALSIVLSFAAVVLSAVLAFKSAPGLADVAASPHDGESERSSARSTRGALDAGLLDAAEAPRGDLAFDAAVPVTPEPTPAEVAGADFHLADGTLVPALGKAAPAHVRFGVVLLNYEGAEGAPEKGARHRSEALSLATKLAEEARTDFHAVVARGDSGSSDDVGAVTRGVLEPGSEAVLFGLPVGGVSGVIDTPRGFWIAKRLE
jgi:PPIC-type PPIASE domain